MRYSKYFVVELFVPTEIVCSIESGYSELRLCKKVDNGLMDVENKKIYQIPDTNRNLVGTKRINTIIPLKEYYHLIGLIKNKNNYRAEEVYKLVKKAKAYKRI